MGLIPQSKQQFMAALSDYAAGMGKSMEDAGVMGAGELCKAALELTPPMVESGGQGLSRGAKVAGYNAVERDIRGLFVAQDERKSAAVGVALNNLAAAVKAGNRGKFERIRQQATLQRTNLINSVTRKIVSDTDPARAFEKASNFFNKSNPVQTVNQQEIVTDIRKVHLSKRHITAQGRMRTSKGTGSYLGKFVVQSKSALEAYIKATQLHVGFIKSGWWQVLSTLPKVGGKNVYKGSEIPVWVRRHAGTGYATLVRNREGINIVIGNRVGDNDSQASKNNVQSVARALAMARLISQLEAYQKDQTNKFNGS
jgi:hypothetical protein